jgi:hypothetical protein
MTPDRERERENEMWPIKATEITNLQDGAGARDYRLE